MKDPRRNASGCIDLTAYEAINNVEGPSEDEKFNKLLRTIWDVCDLAGFEVGNRIVLIDKVTGKVWK